MEQSLERKNTRKLALVIPFTSSVLLTLFLFYIDEGYYSFAWMKQPAAWVVFAFYVLFFLLVKSGIFTLVSFFLKKLN